MLKASIERGSIMFFNNPLIDNNFNSSKYFLVLRKTKYFLIRMLFLNCSIHWIIHPGTLPIAKIGTNKS